MENLTTWSQIQSLFEQAVELDRDRQEEFLRDACDGDSELMSEVESLLNTDQAGDDELEVSPIQLLSADPASRHVTDDSIPGYKILKEIHRGGQGIVYEAIQKSTKRKVALKLMLEGRFASPANRRRFEREVELLSSLRAPGIVPIYDSGIAEGKYFYAMAYIEGVWLDKHVRDNQLSQNESLRLFAKICDAMDHAHQKGVIHRDLKPSNILVDEHNEAHIVDFGLAKAAGFELEHDRVSVTGQIMGTPTYMSPEQASGRLEQVDLRSDVYSLGIVLYKLLSGQLPYEIDGSLAETLAIIQEVEPKKLTFRGSGISNELGTIVLKAISKEKARRYPTAGTFGEDIRRFLSGEPVEAKRDSVLYVLRKTVRHHLLPFSIAAAFLVTVIASSIVSWAMYLSAEKARAEESKLVSKYQEASRQFKNASEKHLQERNRADDLTRQAKEQLYFAEMNLAGQAVNIPGGTARIEELTNRWLPKPGEHDPRGWEWYYLNSLCNHPRTIIKMSQPGEVCRWNPSGDVLAVMVNQNIEVFDASTGKRVKRFHHADLVQPIHRGTASMAWSHDGGMLAITADDLVHVFDFESGENLRCGIKVSARITSICWHPKTYLLTMACEDGLSWNWFYDKSSHRWKHESTMEFPDTNAITSIDWNHDGTCIAVGTEGGMIRITRNDPAEELAKFQCDSSIVELTWHDHVNQLATATTDGEILIHTYNPEQKTLKKTHEFQFTSEPASSIDWNNDPDVLAVSCEDKTVRIVQRSGTVLREIPGKYLRQNDVQWNPAGDLLAVASDDTTLKIWYVKPDLENRQIYTRGPYSVFSASLSPDDQRIAIHPTSPLVIFLKSNGEHIREVKDHLLDCTELSWSPNGSYMASCGLDGHVITYQMPSGDPILHFTEHAFAEDVRPQNRVWCLTWSSDSRLIASGSKERGIYISDAVTGEVTRHFEAHSSGVRAIAWHPTRPIIVSASDGTIIVWNSQDGEVIQTINAHDKSINDLRFSPSGNLFSSASDDWKARIWRLETGELIQELSGHLGPVVCTRWHPDGSRIATCSHDGTIKLWTQGIEFELLSIEASSAKMTDIDWSHSGTKLISSDVPGKLRVWDGTLAYELQGYPRPDSQRRSFLTNGAER